MGAENLVTLEIGAVLTILVVALVLFITEKIRMDVVSLMVLAALALSGLVTPNQALAGFSNPAVVTVWAVFILSGGLSKTGVANLLGQQMMRVCGTSQTRIIVVVMLFSGVMSAFMNNIGVAALLLPVVMDIARRTGNPPSRLLMPLAYGSLLGGLTTLIGTPPNLLVSEALREAGMVPFQLFDFSGVGGVVMVSGIIFITIFAQLFLPARDPARDTSKQGLHLREQYADAELMFVMRPSRGSMLIGKTLAQSRIGATLDLNVFAIIRDGRTRLAPEPHTVLQATDQLLVQGQIERFKDLQGWREIKIEGRDPELEERVMSQLALAEVEISPSSELVGQTLFDIDLLHRYGVQALAVVRDGAVHRSALRSLVLQQGDRLLVEGRPEPLEVLDASADFDSFHPVREEEREERYGSNERVFMVRVPPESVLVGRSLEETRLGDSIGLRALALVRGDELSLTPKMHRPIEADDRLMLAGAREDLYSLRGLQQLELVSEKAIDPQKLESEDVGLMEAILSPRSRIAGQSLRQIQFRERFGVRVLAILREGQALRTDLAALPLRFGDGLLLLGDRGKLKLLAAEPDFLVISESMGEPTKSRLAPLSMAIMAAVLLPVLLGYLPISIAAVSGATLMVLTGCLTMEEAYHSIEWRSIFLIAGMLPLGVAMEQTGAAGFLAEGMLSVVRPLGPWGAIAGLYLVTAMATMIIPTAALVVLMAPIALTTSADLGLNPYAVMMAIAMAASASFTSPISHPANVLVMGPGGYRFVDYVKLGVPLTIFIFVVVMLVLGFFFPIRL